MKYWIYITFFLAVTACQRDLLDSTPQTSYSDATVWQDSTLAKLFVSKLYSTLPSEYESSSMLADYTDEACDNRTFDDPYIINPLQFTAQNSPFNIVWTTMYVNIRNCNTFFANIGKVPASDALKSRWKGEVHFLRAYYYYTLHCYFGRFVIMTDPLSPGDNKVFTPRASEDQCQQFMAADLDSAAALLPVSYTGADIGRVTRGAAYALKCRIALYAGNWQAASDAALEVMKPVYGYSLFPDYSMLFQPQNDNNKEVIFDKQYIADYTSGQGSLIDWTNSPPNLTGKATGVNDPTESFVSLYEMKDGTPFDWNNPAEAARPWFNRDPRLESSITHDSSLFTTLKSVVPSPILIDMKLGSPYNPGTRPSVTGYYMKKFLNLNYDHTATSVTTYSGQNFIILRYAEILLNYAEAQYKLGNIEEARKYVNMVRVRNPANPQMPEISAAGFTWDSYVHERRIELAFEGTRIWDINRWQQGPAMRGSDLYGVKVIDGMPRTYQKVVAQKGGVDRVWDNKMYLCPIPQTEIDKYPGGTLEQNTGW